MTPGRAWALAVSLLCAAAGVPGSAVAQSFVPQPQLYLLSTDVTDARALWLQPANLARRREASVSALLTVNRGPGGTSLGQYGLTLASGVLAFGWQHDRRPAGVSNNTFVVGLAGGTPAVSVGLDHRWYKGTNTSDGSWDLGGRYFASRVIEASVVWRDISTPVVVGDTIFSTLVPGVALQLFSGHARVGADWEIVTKGWTSSAVRIGASAALLRSFVLNVRAEFSGKLSARGLAVSLTWGGPGARATAFGTAVRGPDVDRVGLWGAAISDPFQTGRRRPGR